MIDSHTLIGCVKKVGILFAILFVLYVFYAKSTGYFSLVPFCHIHIYEKGFGGDVAQQIKQTIAALKVRDRAGYHALCTAVDQIHEDVCRGYDWHLDPARLGLHEPGCFLKGSHALYLIPKMYVEGDDTRDTRSLESRVATLGALARKAEQYWATR